MYVSDYVLNGQAHGEAASFMESIRFDPGFARPFRGKGGEVLLSVNSGKYRWDDTLKREVPIPRTITTHQAAKILGYYDQTWNATTMRKEQWIHLDGAVVKAARQRLRAWADLMSASSVGGFNGEAKMTYEYEAMSDPGEALVDMEGLADGRTDRPLFKLRSVPLPYTYSDFYFSKRNLSVMSGSSTPLDTTMAEAAGRRVAEMVEQTLIGTVTGATYGTQTAGVGAHDSSSSNKSQVYGYTTYPFRSTKTDLTTPDGTNPEAVKQDVIEMRETMYSNGFFGPFVLYHSTGYDAYLDDDYFRSGATTGAMAKTLRERIKEIDGIQDVRRLDYLTSGYQMVLVQMTSDVVQAINGMDLTTYQWPSQGGRKVNWRVAAIWVPAFKATYSGTTGLVHGTTS